MPLFEYRCRKCTHVYESLAKNALSPAEPCPKCGSKSVEKLFSTFSAPSSAASSGTAACNGPSCGLPMNSCCGGSCGLN